MNCRSQIVPVLNPRETFFNKLLRIIGQTALGQRLQIEPKYPYEYLVGEVIYSLQSFGIEPPKNNNGPFIDSSLREYVSDTLKRMGYFPRTVEELTNRMARYDPLQTI
ncbi:hypothetical protein A3K63_04970 [Candidatus Micrarchaeota archaeon RBG_16_49_10]|nr:MAG: hypothetical protein A3K63_04970 [Candidatus Micrarchaeota archaeon RBG_16_49_10]